MAQKFRNWCITINNWKEKDLASLKELKYRYLIVGDEVGKQGTPHLQVFVALKSQSTMSALKKKLPTAHLEVTAGSPEDNKKYCSKEKVLFEDGDIPQQGSRKDLTKVKQEILDGKLVEDLCLEDPMLYHQYGRTLHKIEDIRMRRVHRTWTTKGIWYYGKTGVGKSHRAFEGYTDKTHYVWKLTKEWQDGYTGQEIVIINDFRGNIAYSELLNIVSWEPYWVERRGREPVPFLAKTVIVTSSLHPADVYHNLAERDSLDQLYGRFTLEKIMKRSDCSEVVKG